MSFTLKFKDLFQKQLKKPVTIFRPLKIVLHGSYEDGTMSRMHNCANWLTANNAVTGLASDLSTGKLLDQRPYSCESSFIVLCVENTVSSSDYNR